MTTSKIDNSPLTPTSSLTVCILPARRPTPRRTSTSPSRAIWWASYLIIIWSLFGKKVARVVFQQRTGNAGQLYRNGFAVDREARTSPLRGQQHPVGERDAKLGVHQVPHQPQREHGGHQPNLQEQVGPARRGRRRAGMADTSGMMARELWEEVRRRVEDAYNKIVRLQTLDRGGPAMSRVSRRDI
jgi:hypothetical protein